MSKLPSDSPNEVGFQADPLSVISSTTLIEEVNHAHAVGELSADAYNAIMACIEVGYEL